MNGLPAKARGFTLLEVLVALAVFAVAALMAYRGLGTVLAGRAQTEAAAVELAGLQTAFLLLERDLAVALPRPVRDELGGVREALRGAPDSGPVLEFTRATLGGPGQAGVQRVGYRLERGRLLRLTWPVLDRAPRTEPYAAPLLEEVNAVGLRFLGKERWESAWPPIGAPSALPRAVEVVLTLSSGATVRRLLRVTG